MTREKIYEPTAFRVTGAVPGDVVAQLVGGVRNGRRAEDGAVRRRGPPRSSEVGTPTGAAGANVMLRQSRESFDNAPAETVNGYFKAELVRGPAAKDHSGGRTAALGIRNVQSGVRASVSSSGKSCPSCTDRITSIVDQAG